MSGTFIKNKVRAFKESQPADTESYIPEHKRLNKTPQGPLEQRKARQQLTQDFQSAQVQKKNQQKNQDKSKKIPNLTPSVQVGRNQETLWNQPLPNDFEAEKLQKITGEAQGKAFRNDYMPFFENAAEEDLEEEYENSRSGAIDANEIEMPSFSGSNSEVNYLLVIFDQIVFKSNSIEDMKEYIEHLLTTDEDLTVDDMILMKKLKISTGIIIE